MNPSISRLIVALPLSFVLSTSVVLLTWSLNAPFADNMLFNFGIISTMAMFTLMCGATIAKIIQTESHDYTQAQLEAMLEGVLLSGDKKLVTVPLSQEELDHIEFDYTTHRPVHIPAPERDKSLEF